LSIKSSKPGITVQKLRKGASRKKNLQGISTRISKLECIMVIKAVKRGKMGYMHWKKNSEVDKDMTRKQTFKDEARVPRNLKIRRAEEQDVPVLLQLIKKLALYERLSHVVTATEEILRRNLFGEKSVAEAILAEYQGAVAGFAVYFYNFSTFEGKPGIFIEDLYVDESHRRQGLGLAMFMHVARLAKEQGCGRLEWSVLDWNEPAIRFYENLGAEPLSDWTTYRLTGQALRKITETH
jgi:GNAT superfamily N-acetyltransferase